MKLIILLTLFFTLGQVAKGDDHLLDECAEKSNDSIFDKDQSANKQACREGTENGPPAMKHYFSVNVNQPESLIANPGNDTQILEGESVVIGGSPSAEFGYGNYTFQWTPIDYLDDPNDPNPTANPPATTIYTLLVTDEHNCTAEGTVVVSVDHLPPDLEFLINNETFISGTLYDFCHNQPVSIKLSEVHQGSPPFDIAVTINQEDVYFYSDVDLENPQLYEGTPEVGVHTIEITQIIDANGTEVEDPELHYNIDIEVWDLPDVSCPEGFMVYLIDEPFDLEGASPEGGVYSGDGVLNGQFDPSLAGVGIWVINYLYQDADTGCENTCIFEIEVTDDTSITDIPQSIIKVFPNPTTGLVNVSSEQPIKEVMLYNMQGQMIYSSKVNSESYKINASDNRPGMYFVRIALTIGVHNQIIMITQPDR